MMNEEKEVVDLIEIIGKKEEKSRWLTMVESSDMLQQQQQRQHIQRARRSSP